MDNRNGKTAGNPGAFARLRPSKRKLIQLYAALLYNCHVKGFIEGDIYTGPLKNVCVPGLNCYSCPGAVGACPLGALQNALASTTTRAPAYMLGIICLFGLLLGRTICGFLCPLGLIQELLYKIPSPKLKKSRVTRALSWLKYVILVAFMTAIPLMYALQHFPVPGFCKYICPAGTLEGAIGLLSNPSNVSKLPILNILFTRKFVILMLIVAACIFIFRVFCRFICPLGAIYGLFARVALVGVRVEPSKCIGCGACVRKCKMDIRHVGDHECINCGECISSCPTQAISWTAFGHRIDPKPAEKKPVWKSVLPWVLALALLAGVAWFVNKPENNSPAQSAASAQTASSTQTASGSAQTDASSPASGSAQTDTSAQTSGFGQTDASAPAAGSTETDSDAQAADSSSAGSGALDASAAAAAEDSSVPVGKDVGMRISDFTCPVYGGDTFSSADQRGKVLVINFWATWCTSCVHELPSFAQIAKEYGDKVSVIAIHSDTVTEDVEAWIARENIDLPFALDETGEILTSFGGSTMLPMTVIVDPSGIITCNVNRAVTYDELHSEIENALSSGASVQAEAPAQEASAEDASSAAAAAVDTSVPVGKDVGMRIPDFTCPVYGGDTFSSADQRGKVLVINFWATWCTSCVHELPSFAQIAGEYGDKVSVIAIHSDTVTEDVEAWIARENIDLPFALDETGNILTSFGGTTMLPMTVIVDPSGIITCNVNRAVTYDELHSEIENALNAA